MHLRSCIGFAPPLHPAKARLEPLRAKDYHHQLLDRTPSGNQPSPIRRRQQHQHHPSACSNQISTAAAAAAQPLQAIRERLRSGASLDPGTVIVSLKSCLRDHPKLGVQIHGLAVPSGLDSHVTVSNSLMNVYSKSGRFDQAHKIFGTMRNHDVVSWNTILSGFGRGEDALEFVVRMYRSGVPFDAVTFTMALAFSSDLRDLDFGSQLHSLVLKLGFESGTSVGNALVTSYARAGLLKEAKRVFDEMVKRDSISWNALISGYTQEENCGLEAIGIFLRMTREGVGLDHISFASAISACSHERSLEFGRQVHGLAITVGLETHISVSNVLMSMYSKCNSVDCAKRVFENMIERNVVSWTTMISIDTESAISLFKEMLMDGVYPNDVTFIALFYAASTENSGRECEMVHGWCYKTGMSRELNVSNSLITMYAKLESMEESKRVFEEMAYREIVSWNALISGYAQNGLCEEALKVFSSLILHSKPNQFTFGSVLSAVCTVETVCLTYGQRCHCQILKLGLDTCEYVAGALIDMYAKRGGIGESQRLFDEMPQKSLITWTAMISAHARHGNYGLVMSLFEDMVVSGVHPDHITFLAILTACGRKGMVDAGCRIFDSMVRDHGIKPFREHYSCMVDMLGRAGRLHEAEKLIGLMPTGPGLSSLQSLLGACRVHGNAEVGQRAADALMEMEPEEPGSYVLMSNIYAERGEWEKVAKLRKRMREKGVKKEVGFSWADVGGGGDSMSMHGFSADDTTHPQAEEIYRVAECLGMEMRILQED